MSSRLNAFSAMVTRDLFLQLRLIAVWISCIFSVWETNMLPLAAVYHKIHATDSFLSLADDIQDSAAEAGLQYQYWLPADWFSK